MEFSLTGVDAANAQTISLSERVFAQAFNDDLVHQVIVAYQAGARQGTKAQKNRAAVRGGGIKPWKQKGTGRARAGTIRSPLWVGGGKTFAAEPRNFMQKVNRKMYHAAMRSILSRIARDGVLKIIDTFTLETNKTKELVARLAQLNLKRVLIVCAELTENLYLAGRNLGHVNVIDVALVDPVSLLSYDHVLVTQEAILQIEGRYA